MNFETLKWIGDVDGCLELTDQRILPERFEKIRCENTGQLYDAIKTLAVRGAPAIGAAAAYGICLAAKNSPANDSAALSEDIGQQGHYLAESRPTAVNLFWAIERMLAELKSLADIKGKSVMDIKAALLNEAHAICNEDKQMCEAIGKNGLRFIKDGMTLITHCNAGALATAGQGTALSPMYEAKKAGLDFRVFVDETRPLLQGSRLTAWELCRADIDAVLICDNMAGALMGRGEIDAVITGADRIAANGDAANKTGTYALAVLAHHHGIPFYIAAPSSTFDMQTDSGEHIPIEQRDADEIRKFRDTASAPREVNVYNPAFDVTPAKYITAIITEKGVIEKPSPDSVSEHIAKK